MIELSKLRLSPSALSTYFDCQRRFFYRYIRGIPEKPTPFLVRGKITHKVLDHFFNYVKLVDIKEGSWEKLWKDFKNVLYSLLETEWKLIGKNYPDCFENEKQKKDFLDETKRFFDFYAAKLAFGLTDKFLELDKKSEWFETELRRFFFPKDRELRLNLEDEEFAGVIDKTMSLFGRGIAIVDYKTSKSPLPHFIPESHLKQGKAYAYLWKKARKELPRHISFYYMRTGESVYYPISEMDVKEIEGNIKEIRTKKPEFEEFLKTPGGLCLSCDYFKFCWGEMGKEEFLKKMKDNSLDIVKPAQ